MGVGKGSRPKFLNIKAFLCTCKTRERDVKSSEVYWNKEWLCFHA
jgi:hypothetical protein